MQADNGCITLLDIHYDGTDDADFGKYDVRPQGARSSRSRPARTSTSCSRRKGVSRFIVLSPATLRSPR